MEIYNFPQYSPEWWAIREKRLTASNAQAIGNFGKGLLSYVNKKMSLYFSNAEPEQYTNKDLERGIELEQQATMVYSFKTGIKTKKVGFITYGEYAGCSPDLFSGKNGLAEIKCPKDEVYFQYIMDGIIDPKYKWQMQMQMLVCDKDWCDYVVYNPNFDRDIIIKRVSPDFNMMYRLICGIEIGSGLIKEATKKYKGGI